MQNCYLKFYCRKVGSTEEMGNFGDYREDVIQSLIWSPGETVQNLESPRLAGRVDAFVAFAETCFCFFKWFLFYNPLKIQ